MVSEIGKAFEDYKSLTPNRDGSSSYTPAVTVQTKPNILSLVAHSTRKRQSEFVQELIAGLNCKIASLGNDIVKKLFPQQTSQLQAARRMVLNAPLFGSPDNHLFSTPQINIS
jgi:hypothetical protein